MANDKLLKLVSMANALTASASALSNAILAYVEEQRNLDEFRLRREIVKVQRKAPKVKKARRQVKRGKKIAKAEKPAEAEVTDKK